MSEELQQKLRAQLWEVANNLRGNMSANEFMYFSLGFIFYKYLSEKIENYADRALQRTFERGNNILLALNCVNDRGEEILRLYKITDIFQTLLLDFLLKFKGIFFA